MHTLDRRSRALAALAVLALVFGACGSAATVSPTPTTPPTSAQSSAPPPTSSSPDASDPVASVEPAPTAPPLEGVELFLAATALGRQIRCTQEEDQCLLEPIEQGDQRWSVLLDGPCRDLLNVDGDAIVACDPTSGATIHVIDQDGNPRRGWPVELGVALATVSWNDLTLGCGAPASSVLVAPDGAFVVATDPGPSAELVVLERNGTRRPGWPQPIPGDALEPTGFGYEGCAGFAVADPSGSIVAWGYEGMEMSMELDAARTEFTIYRPDGSVVDGWPRGSTGAASGPILRPDGGIAYTSASGKVWAHGPDGEIAAGWPYAIPSLSDSERIGAPIAGGDGRLAVIQESYTDDGPRTRLHIVLHDGRLAGPVIELPGPVETTCLFGDTPCVGRIDPVFHPRNHDLFIALGSGDDDADPPEFGGSILAFDADGRVRDGWPVALGEGVHAQALSMSLDGPLIVEGITCPQDGCAGGGVSTPISIVIDRDGTILSRVPPD